jgi:hypothetical protein
MPPTGPGGGAPLSLAVPSDEMPIVIPPGADTPDGIDGQALLGTVLALSSLSLSLSSLSLCFLSLSACLK